MAAGMSRRPGWLPGVGSRRHAGSGCRPGARDRAHLGRRVVIHGPTGGFATATLSRQAAIPIRRATGGSDAQARARCGDRGTPSAAAPRAPSGAPARVATTMPARASASTVGRVQLTFLTPIDSKYEIAPSEGSGPPEPTALPLTSAGRRRSRLTSPIRAFLTERLLRTVLALDPAAVVSHRLGFGKEGADRFGDAALTGASNVDRHDRPGARRILGRVALAHGKGGLGARRPSTPVPASQSNPMGATTERRRL